MMYSHHVIVPSSCNFIDALLLIASELLVLRVCKYPSHCLLTPLISFKDRM